LTVLLWEQKLGITRIDVGAFEAELSVHARQRVELLQRLTAAGQPACFVVPVQRSALADPFWQAYKASPMAGIADTPQGAIVLFVKALARWRPQTPASRRGAAIEGALRERLLEGWIPAADLFADFERVGVSRDTLGRIARRIGVLRRKQGMLQGWIWALPNVGQ
jgi:hypothetical protein